MSSDRPHPDMTAAEADAWERRTGRVFALEPEIVAHVQAEQRARVDCLVHLCLPTVDQLSIANYRHLARLSEAERAEYAIRAALGHLLANRLIDTAHEHTAGVQPRWIPEHLKPQIPK